MLYKRLYHLRYFGVLIYVIYILVPEFIKMCISLKKNLEQQNLRILYILMHFLQPHEKFGVLIFLFLQHCLYWTNILQRQYWAWIPALLLPSCNELCKALFLNLWSSIIEPFSTDSTNMKTYFIWPYAIVNIYIYDYITGGYFCYKIYKCNYHYSFYAYS